MTAPAATESQRASMRERKATHWFLRVVSPETSVIVEMPKDDTGKRVMGLAADMLHGATMFVSGAINPLTAGCREVVPCLTPKEEK